MKLKKFILNLTFIALFGCIVLSSNTSPPVNNDPYTGLYYVHGTKIVTYYRCPFIDVCGPDAGPFHDTTRISSVVAVKLMQDKTDTLHFLGLPGADEGEIKLYHGSTQVRDYAGSISLYDEIDRYKIYGSLLENTFSIAYNNVGSRFNANGSITNRTLIVQGLKTFRTITVEYDLEGEKIDH